MTANALTTNHRTNLSPLGSSTRGTLREPHKKKHKPSRRRDSISVQLLVMIDELTELAEPIIVRSRTRQEQLDTLAKVLKTRVIRKGRRRGAIPKSNVVHEVAYKVASYVLDEKLVDIEKIDMSGLKGKQAQEFAIVVTQAGSMFIEAHGRANNSSVRGIRRQTREEVAA